ncbi:hypothetical protein V8B97DRAFT_2023278 [Scleroderma yunnanense]
MQKVSLSQEVKFKEKAFRIAGTKTSPVKVEDDKGDSDEIDEEDSVQSEAENEAGPSEKDEVESHTAQRTLQEQGKAVKPHSQLLANAKRVWSLRRQRISHPLNVIQGKFVLKHDASRIIQSVVKYGGRQERDQIAAGLLQSKYSKFLVTKLIRLYAAYCVSIISEFRSNVLRLLLQREASGAFAFESSILLRDFCDKEVALFSSDQGTQAETEKAKKDLTSTSPLGITHSIVDRAPLAVLGCIHAMQNETEQEKMRREIFESCQDVLAEMFLTHGTAEDRKHIVKVIKPHIIRMCIDEEAQLGIFTVLDRHHTKPTAKSLVSDITSNTELFITSPQGRRSLFYLFVTRTKKDNVPRTTEFRQAVNPSLLKSVEKKEAEIVRDTRGSLIDVQKSLTKGHFSCLAKTVERTESFSAAQFASALLFAVDKEVQLAVAEGHGTFLVAKPLKRIQEEGSDKERKKSFISNLRDHDVKGNNVRIEKIEVLL